MDLGSHHSLRDTQGCHVIRPGSSYPGFLYSLCHCHDLGAVLTQNKHPIAYFSKALGPPGQAKSIYEKELMAIVLAVHKWQYYLLGRHFVVWTDQRSLRFILE